MSLGVLFVLFLIVPQFFKIDLFYHSFARFWELCFGGLVFAYSARFDTLKFTDKFKLLIYLVFLVAIATTCKNTQFDLYETLFVVISTGFLILVLVNNTNQKIFSSTPLVFLGLISFPLYLWHYVFISYIHIFGLDVQAYGFVVIFISVLVSYVTYRYVELYARKQTSYRFVLILFSIAIVLGFFGQYTNKQKGFPQRSHMELNEKFQSQFVRTPAQNKTGIALMQKTLGYKPTNDYIKSTSDDINKKFIAIIGDSHAHTSFPGFAQEFAKQGYETLILANSGCPPYINGGSGKSIDQVHKCQNKINDIYQLLNKFSEISKVIFVVRGPSSLYQIGYGLIDHGIKRSDWGYIEYFQNKEYNHSKEYFKKVEDTFSFFNSRDALFYYVLENPELGFSPKNCIIRPFFAFQNKCRLKYIDYSNRMNEYRIKTMELSKKYENISILDPEKLFCDSEYCYAIRDEKMLYSDDDYLSIDGSKAQANYFNSKINEDEK